MSLSKSTSQTQVVDSSKPQASDFVDPDDLRTAFSQAMSAMYRAEVPLYGDLIRIVNETNTAVLATSPDAKIEALRKHGNVAAERLDLERHGAIRLGKPEELRTVRRLFNIIGLQAVGYYDLSVAGLPMHATAFRPTTPAALKKNPFRVFTTLLRPELLVDKKARDLALSLLARRNIFTPELMSLIAAAESPVQGGRLTHEQAPRFVTEAMKTFSWRAAAVATEAEYLQLKAEHPILADIACFQSSHINHLTPRTLDIETAQDKMLDDGLAIKDRIEGPPRRNCPILLRQTSFLALEEKIRFPQSLDAIPESTSDAVDEETLLDDTAIGSGNGGNSSSSAKGYKIGTHKARFGEIEERGAAVTPLGRKLYDRLLAETDAAAKTSSSTHQRQLHQRMDEASVRIFGESYPDTWEALRKQDLVYFTYKPTDKASSFHHNDKTRGTSTVTLEGLLSDGIIDMTPITYEDFLPFSAAGIFQSNLQQQQSYATAINHHSPATSPSKQPGQVTASVADVEGLEGAMGCKVLDANDLYAHAQSESLRRCEVALGLPEGSL